MNNSSRQELTQATFTALKWSYGSTVIKVISQMLIGVVLARLLGPKPFGLVAVAWIVIGFGNLIADFGFGAALVQRKEVSEREVRYAFTIQVLIGVALTLVIASSAGLIAQLFRQPPLVPVIQVLSLIFAIQAFSQTAVSLLKRDLNFKYLRLAELLSYVLAFILLGIPLAYLGYGVWSLIAAQLAQSMLYSVLIYGRVRHPIKLTLSLSSNLLGFGSRVMGTNILNWIIENMDNAFVGRFFGVYSLGLYNRAYSLMTAPTSSFITVLQGVLFPAYSRAQDETKTISRVYIASAGVTSLVVLPIFCSVAVVPRTVIQGLYGNRWLGAAPLLVPLALAVPFHAVMALAGPLIWGKGKVGRELAMQGIVAVLFLFVLLVTSKLTVLILAWGVFGVYAVRFVLMTWAALRVINASWRSLFCEIRGGAILGLWASVLIWGVEKALLTFNMPVAVRLVIDILATGVGTIGIVLIIPSLLFSAETVWLISRFSGSIPVAIRSFIRFRGLEVG